MITAKEISAEALIASATRSKRENRFCGIGTCTKIPVSKKLANGREFFKIETKSVLIGSDHNTRVNNERERDGKAADYKASRKSFYSLIDDTVIAHLNSNPSKLYLTYHNRTDENKPESKTILIDNQGKIVDWETIRSYQTASMRNKQFNTSMYDSIRYVKLENLFYVSMNGIIHKSNDYGIYAKLFDDMFV